MATSTISNSDLRILIQFFLILQFLLCSSKNGNAQQPNELGQHSHSHIVSVTSLLPSTASVCNRALPTVLDGQVSLEVASKHGPCSNINQGKRRTPFSQILRQDQIRVKSIHSKKKKHRLKTGRDHFMVPAKSGTLLTSLNYFATIGVGTPKQSVSLILDSGSDITFTQCKPCSNCYRQVEPLFEPAKSKSYNNIPCSASICNYLSASGHHGQYCKKNACIYGISYLDGSYSFGALAKEKLTLQSSDGKTTTTISNYVFGCGFNNNDTIEGLAGVMGLDRSPLSIVYQTSHRFGQYFSTCFPGIFSSSTGYINFGKPNTYTSKLLKFTPITTPPNQSIDYDIAITGLSVAGRKLSISSSVFTKAGAIIDSGTILTRLPPAAFLALRSAISQNMRKYKLIKSEDSNDLCYDFGGYDSVVLPKVSIFLKDGVEFEVDAAGIFYMLDEKTPYQVCLAFSPNGNENDGAILGNYQFQGMEVHYDVAGGRIGFGPRVC